MLIRLSFPILTLIIFASFTSAQENNSKLEIAEIMKGKEFTGYWPESQFWSIDGKHIYFQWNPNKKLKSQTHKVNIQQTNISPTLSDQENNIAYDPSQANFKLQIFLFKGNLYTYDKKNNQHVERIIGSQYIKEFFRLKNESEIVYRIDNNLFLYNLTTGQLKQITSIFKGKAPFSIDPDVNDPLIEQQKMFLEVQKTKQSQEKKSNPNADQFYLEGRSLDFLSPSSCGDYVYIGIGDYPETKKTHVEHHISQDGYTFIENARPKAGANEPTHSLFVYDRTKDTVVEINFNKLPGIRKKPEYLEEYGDTTPTYSEDRKIVFHPPVNSLSGKTIMDIRSYDNKDRWIVEIEPKNFSFQIIDHQHDEAWIGGPGISGWNRSPGTLGFWDNDRQVYFQSEKSGYSHLYTYDFQTQETQQLTAGKFEIHRVQRSNRGKGFYITANKSHPGNRGFYLFEPKTKKWTPLLDKEGAHDVEISPDEKKLAVLYSSKTEPWELYLIETNSSDKRKQLTHSTLSEYNHHDWYSPKVISFSGEDNKKVYARLYEPESSVKNKAAVIFVHGAGYLQNAHNYWSVYFREFMFHNFLRENGYTVLDIDYRASEGYGRDHRTAIYRHMGGLDLQDQLSGKKRLVDSLGIDSNRVGIYGGSYGGFITLMALLTKPNEFACGAALRSVTDWMHYNHEYTTNILNYPKTDSIAYWRSSPINFANNLVDPLLILHGMVDNNVQFQDVVRLNQRFIELGKKNWDIAIYPNEGHSFSSSYSWTDEYERIFKHFELNLKHSIK